MLTPQPEGHYTAPFLDLSLEEGNVHISLPKLHTLISTRRHPVTGEDVRVLSLPLNSLYWFSGLGVYMHVDAKAFSLSTKSILSSYLNTAGRHGFKCLYMIHRYLKARVGGLRPCRQRQQNIIHAKIRVLEMLLPRQTQLCKVRRCPSKPVIHQHLQPHIQQTIELTDNLYFSLISWQSSPASMSQKWRIEG